MKRKFWNWVKNDGADEFGSERTLLSQAVEETKGKLTELKSVQDQMDEGLKNGSVTQQQYDAWKREIIATEEELKNLETQTKNTDSAISATLKEAGSKVSAVGDKISGVGETMTKNVTAPITAVGAASLAAFSEVDEGMDTIVTKTGATGEALESMENIAKDIATTIPTSFAEAGTAVGEVNTRFGLTGKALQDLSTQFIEFASIRKLKEHGVECFFEKENIYTFDSKGELLITIMSSIAQEESRSISENVTWGQRKRFADGKVSMPYKHFLGYCKGPDGLPQVVEKEAAVVRSIYLMFLEGRAPTYIAKALTEQGISTPSGKTRWQGSTVESILTNEKYKGDALLQKRFTVDFLTKTMKTNEGEAPQYYVTDSHEGIISPEVFELAQYEFQRRREKGGYQSHSDSPFSGHIVCGECGAYYGHKVWHSNDKYRRLVWYCNKKYGKGAGDGLRCKTPHLTDDEVKEVFVGAMNAALQDKQEILDNCRAAVTFLIDTNQLESDLHTLEAERDVATELLRKCIDENAHAEISQEDYETKYAALAARYETAKGKCESMNEKILQRKLKANRIEAFFKTMETSDLINAFDEGLWNATVDTMTVYSKKKIVLKLKDGTEIKWHL